MLTIGSLFSGIGGLECGLEWAGLGPVLWQVERVEFCRRVLERHWPEVPRYDDVRRIEFSFGPVVPRVDLVCGGFPCQDVSSAGTRVGLAGSRSGLWREFARVLGWLRPEWVVVENVAGGARLWVDAVVRELGQLGYAALPCPVSAWAVGASHERQRIFVVAHAHRDELRGKQGGAALRARAAELTDDGSSAGADVDGDRQHAVSVDGEVGASSSADADPALVGRDPRLLLGCAPADARRGARCPDQRAFTWGFEPDLVRAVHGIPRRVDRIRALGNAVVPQCAEVVGWVIRELAGLT